MPCIAAPKIPRPAGLDLLLPSGEIHLPGIGGDITFCCTMPIPPIGPIILPLGLIPGVAVVLQPVMAVIMAVIDLLNSLLDLLQVSCPLE